MSDYRNPNDPLWRGGEYEPVTRGADIGWGWIAGAAALIIIVAIAFGVGHSPTETASNDTRSISHTEPPIASRPMNPANPGLTPPPAQQNIPPQ